MKKNKTLRLASCLLIATLCSTCVISGTFAKYTTSVNSEDTARVATWGFTETSMDITGLFDEAYDSNNVKSEVDVIAPGTTGSATFTFKYDGATDAPEVAYTFTVSTTGSTIANDLKNNTSIQWKLDTGSWGTWDAMIAAIEALSGEADGSKDYVAGALPDEFTASDDVHTIAWQWLYEADTNGDSVFGDNDSADTALGNKATLDSVKVVITITATQID